MLHLLAVSQDLAYLQAGDRADTLEIVLKSLLPLRGLTRQMLSQCTDEDAPIQDILGLQRILEVLSWVIQICVTDVLRQEHQFETYQ